MAKTIRVRCLPPTNHRAYRLSVSDGCQRAIYSFRKIENRLDEEKKPSHYTAVAAQAANDFVDEYFTRLEGEVREIHHGTFEQDDYFIIERKEVRS